MQFPKGREYYTVSNVARLNSGRAGIYHAIRCLASAWNYSSTVAGMPLSYLWVKSMNSGYIDDNDRKTFEDFSDMSEVIDYGKRVILAW